MAPIDILFLLLTPATYAVLLAAESLWPARAFPPRRRWQWIGAVFLVLSMAIGTVMPLWLPMDWLAAHRLVDGTGLGVAGGTVVGFVVLELAVYAWHRSAHTFGLMWRGFHQLHHSPRRVDMAGSLVFHPLESAAYTLIALAVAVFVLGLVPLAASLAIYVYAFYGLFQHCNVRTPRWLGYLIQRPESHCAHHGLGIHYYNFADLPLWDIAFGTFRNPATYDGPCGFEGGADRRMGAMLRFVDVNAVPYGAGSRGVKPAADGTARIRP